MSGAGGLRAPPGRAGRLWLRGRLQLAERDLDLLDRKLRILRGEQERLALLAQRTSDDFQRACTEAETWLLRAALLGGQRAIRLAADSPPAEVAIAWRDTMGIRYPIEATCSSPLAASPPLTTTAALDRAAAAHRAALAAAARHAATTAAVRIVDAEVTATRLRLRAIQDRWIPRLEATLAEVELALEELEHADAVRLRRAAAAQPRTAGRQP